MRRVWRFTIAKYEVRVEVDTDGIPRPRFYRWGEGDGGGWSLGLAPVTDDAIFSIDFRPRR